MIFSKRLYKTLSSNKKSLKLGHIIEMFINYTKKVRLNYSFKQKSFNLIFSNWTRIINSSLNKKCKLKTRIMEQST